MSTSLAARTVITAVYLAALALDGLGDTRSLLLAVVVLAVWAVPLLRDGRLRRSGTAAVRS